MEKAEIVFYPPDWNFTIVPTQSVWCKGHNFHFFLVWKGIKSLLWCPEPIIAERLLSPATAKMLKTIALCLLWAALCRAGGWDCNELEEKVNQERRNHGLKPLLCDQHMRWVSGEHIQDAEDAGYKGFVLKGGELVKDTPEGCNLHSWYTKFPCCYPRDSDCGYNHPYVSIKEKLANFDKLPPL